MAALAADGVVAIFTLDDLRDFLTDTVMPVEQPSNALKLSASPSVLADGEVRYVGEPIAMVIAETPYGAEDAAALVDVSYDTLPVSSDLRCRAEDGAPKANNELKDNNVAGFTLSYGDVDSAFANAAHVFRETLHQHKGLGHAIECRVSRCTAKRTRWKVDRMVSNPNSTSRTIHPRRAIRLARRQHPSINTKRRRRLWTEIRFLSRRGRNPNRSHAAEQTSKVG